MRRDFDRSGFGATRATARGVSRLRRTGTVTPRSYAGGGTDDRGWGLIASASAHWYSRHPWPVGLRYNYAHTNTSITTQTYQIGFGIRLPQRHRRGGWPEHPQQLSISHRHGF
jgi:hypothetical protein